MTKKTTELKKIREQGEVEIPLVVIGTICLIMITIITMLCLFELSEISSSLDENHELLESIEYNQRQSKINEFIFEEPLIKDWTQCQINQEHHYSAGVYNGCVTACNDFNSDLLSNINDNLATNELFDLIREIRNECITMCFNK